MQACLLQYGSCQYLGVHLQQKKAKHKATPTPESSQDKPAKKSKAKPKAKAEDAEENGGAKAKKPRKKKDKDEPKKGLSAFMFFSQANREKVGASTLCESCVGCFTLMLCPMGSFFVKDGGNCMPWHCGECPMHQTPASYVNLTIQSAGSKATSVPASCVPIVHIRCCFSCLSL